MSLYINWFIHIMDASFNVFIQWVILSLWIYWCDYCRYYLIICIYHFSYCRCLFHYTVICDISWTVKGHQWMTYVALILFWTMPPLFYFELCRPYFIFIRQLTILLKIFVHFSVRSFVISRVIIDEWNNKLSYTDMNKFSVSFMPRFQENNK